MWVPNERLWMLLQEARTDDALRADAARGAARLAQQGRQGWLIRWAGRLLYLLGSLLITLGRRLAECEAEPLSQVSAQG